MTIKRTSHAVYDTSYHLVWCSKYRKKIFERADFRERAGQLIREISEDYGFDVIEMEIS
ncbi:MAG: transposase, partial [Deltaproteobacteria bacterium]|nr:transposase [Deltaproteobacteria bacterium]